MKENLSNNKVESIQDDTSGVFVKFKNSRELNLIKDKEGTCVLDGVVFNIRVTSVTSRSYHPRQIQIYLVANFLLDEPPKELTIEQIQEKLGFKIKIVEGK